MNKFYKLKETTISSQVEEESVVVSLEKGMINSINSSGTEILSLIKQDGKTFDEILAEIIILYDVDEYTLRADIKDYLSNLIEQGLIYESETR